jgi:hypothetical protein
VHEDGGEGLGGGAGGVHASLPRLGDRGVTTGCSSMFPSARGSKRALVAARAGEEHRGPRARRSQLVIENTK